MARNVGDLALFLDAMVDHSVERQTGWDFDAPKNLPMRISSYTELLQTESALNMVMPQRIAWSPDLGGLLQGALNAELLDICEKAAQWFGQVKSTSSVESGRCPDLSEARMVFNILRGESFAQSRADDWNDPARRQLLKPEILWNVNIGHEAKTRDALVIAQAAHERIFSEVQAFFRDYDMLITPCTIVPPFDAQVRYPTKAGQQGVQFCNYIDWMAMSWAVTVMQCPALAIPIGFCSAGLPVGLQLIAKPFAEPVLLAAAAAFEAAHPDIAASVPIEPRRGCNPLGTAVDGPRTPEAAHCLAQSKAASIESVLTPVAPGAQFFSSTSNL